MKHLFVISLVLILQVKLISQETLDSPLIEIFTLVEDPSPNPSGNYNYTLSAIGTVWKVIKSQSSGYYDYFEYDIDIYNEASGGIVNPIINAPYSQYTGFNFIPFDDHSYPEFGFGLYKLKLFDSKFFYLDYRDVRYGFYQNCVGHCADIWIKYKVDSGKFYLSTNHSYWIEIPVSEYIKIWEIKGQGPQIVNSRVDNFWQNCLVLIPTSDNHPRLVWGPYPERKQGSCSLFC
jgi:hypothetical protein